MAGSLTNYSLRSVMKRGLTGHGTRDTPDLESTRATTGFPHLSPLTAGHGDQGVRFAPFAIVWLSWCLLWPVTVIGGNTAAADFTTARQAMVKEQLEARGIADASVLKAMTKVPRHEFVTEELRPFAYADRPLPIGEGQTISQPYIVAFMTEVLLPKASDRVLEIGTGSGYQAAVLSGLVAQVYTIEIIGSLARQAEATLGRLGYRNVKVRTGDGYRGWPEEAPFDAIIVTCAPDAVPPTLIAQLKEGGRMIIPVGERFTQELYLLEKRKGEIMRKGVLPVLFVPMTGESQKRPSR